MDISADYQRKLFPYAYNILGSVDDAKDIVQDVIVDYFESKRDNINNTPAYLIKSVINKSINLKKRNQKIAGAISWLPDPIAADNADAGINRREIISYSLLVLLEYLNPKERAVFILKQAFDYSHQEIAEVFSISIENSKQLLSRAKKTLQEKGADLKVEKTSADHFLLKYVDVIKSGDIKMLEEMLAEQITLWTGGGGGKGLGLIKSIGGINAVAQLVASAYDLHLKKFRIECTSLTNSPALLFYKGERLLCCQVFDVDTDTGKINKMYFIAGREKLKHL
ncbi:sigma-70 family RNA polymerase sigma factor [Longitalea arenae]|uniref:sigma-70 family RNA polymerase sigma factor n=1 Tax=Longitalea arenae TaxID=2812558 RepID=UPI001967EBD1|nr:sigma-70 family RNA polymerase sigma factor [Longitalea arenae]